MEVHTEWLLTPERAAVHLPSATAVIADLHLGYAEARCQAGESVPLQDLDDGLAPLRSLVVRCDVKQLVLAGDLFENAVGAALAEPFRQAVEQLGMRVKAVVPGNHDRGIAAGTAALPFHPNGVQVGGWHVRHGDARLPRGRVIMGHLHPCLTWATRRTSPCYLVGPRRIVLPAFSAEARGVNVLGCRSWAELRCLAIAGDRVLDFGPVGLLTGKLRRQRRKA